MTPEKFMRHAIDKTSEGVRNGQSPFGACLVKGGEIISCEHNMVRETGDVTAHAEIQAIRNASRKLDSTDLSGCVLYCTCEPCPMCFSACHFAKISRVVFGTLIKDAREWGFNPLPISSEMMKELGRSSIEIEGCFMREESMELFKSWDSRKARNLAESDSP